MKLFLLSWYIIVEFVNRVAVVVVRALAVEAVAIVVAVRLLVGRLAAVAPACLAQHHATPFLW